MDTASATAAEEGLAGYASVATASATPVANPQQHAPAPACRICLQDDDPDSLENPCNCSGSMAVSSSGFAGI